MVANSEIEGTGQLVKNRHFTRDRIRFKAFYDQDVAKRFVRCIAIEPVSSTLATDNKKPGPKTGFLPFKLFQLTVALFRRRLAEEYVAVTEDNRPLYRELAAAGLMYPVSGFTRGPEANFRLTDEGWMRRHEILAPPAGSP